MVAGIYVGTRSIDALRTYNPQDLFSGAATVQAPLWALASLPWTAIVVSIGAAILFLTISIVITEKLEF